MMLNTGFIDAFCILGLEIITCVTEHGARKQHGMAHPARKQHLLMEASQAITRHPCPARKRQDKAGVYVFGLEVFPPQDCGKGGGREQAGMPGLSMPGQEGQLGTMPSGKVKLSQGVVRSQEGF